MTIVLTGVLSYMGDLEKVSVSGQFSATALLWSMCVMKKE
jgi:hypothetical protein